MKLAAGPIRPRRRRSLRSHPRSPHRLRRRREDAVVSRRRGTGRRPARTRRSSSRSAVRSYRCPAGASASARATAPLARSSSSSPCRSSSVSQSVQKPGPDAIRAGSSASGTVSLSPGWASGMDEGMTGMAKWAGNKAPGERKRSRQPRSYQELCSISGGSESCHASAINMPPDRDQPRKPGHQNP